MEVILAVVAIGATGSLANLRDLLSGRMGHDN